MAKYRMIMSALWTGESTDIHETWTQDEIYFYIFLLSNPNTTNCGCYQIGYKTASEWTKFTTDVVEELFKRFEKTYKKIQYCKDTKEVLLLNWHKYNWTGSPTYMASVDKEIAEIKCDKFREYLLKLREGQNAEFDDTTEAKQKRKKAEPKPVERYFPNDDLLEEKFAEYLKSCSEKGKKKTSKAIKMFIEKLYKNCTHEGEFYADYAVSILDTCIEHGWLSFDPTWRGMPKSPWEKHNEDFGYDWGAAV